MKGGKPDPNAARAWLRDVLSSNKTTLQRYLHDKADPSEEVLAKVFPYQSGPLPAQLDGIALLLLLNWAETTPAGFSFLRNIIAGLVRSGQPVPEAWRDLHAGIVDGSVTAPSAGEGRHPVNQRRDELVLWLVIMMQDKFGLPRLANALSRHGASAIEIVTDELNEHLGLSFPALGSIEKALDRREKARSADPIFRVIYNRRKERGICRARGGQNLF